MSFRLTGLGDALSLDRPRPLLDCPPEALRAVSCGVDVWTLRKARQLDQVLRARVLMALSGRLNPDKRHGPAGADELLALVKVLNLPIARQSRPSLLALEDDWLTRWRGWADLLDGQVLRLWSLRDAGLDAYDAAHPLIGPERQHMTAGGQHE